MSLLRHIFVSVLLCFIGLTSLSAAAKTKIDFEKQVVGVPQNIIVIEQYDTHKILILDNDLILDIRTPPMEWRTFWEWCTGTKHQQPDERFFFDVGLWSAPIPVQLYEYKYDAENATRLFQNDVGNLATHYPYLLLNIRTNEYLFCRILKATEFLQIVHKQAEGQYQIGYDQGTMEGDRRGYNQGYEKGYKQGLLGNGTTLE